MATDGTLLPVVPFNLSLHPLELRVQADRQSGLFSGDFEVGILVKPGPTQYRMAEVMDLVQVYATGSPEVQFFSQLPHQPQPAAVEMSIVPVSWDVRTGFFYDLTCEVYFTNNSPQDRTISLGSGVTHLDNITQTVARLERDVVFVRSGTTEVVLLALAISAYELARSEVVVVATAEGGVEILPQRVLVNCDPAADVPVYYQVVNASTYTFTIGSPINIPFTTANGPEGIETWGVNNPEFLSDHNLRFRSDGVLKSDGNVLGPATQVSLMFTVRKETGIRTRVYASKIINIVITP